MTWVPRHAIRRLEDALRGERAAPLQAGERLAGRFRVDALIATGGMCSVYRGFDEQRGQPVAVKVLRDPGDASRGDARRGRFEREIAIVESLVHPRIVRHIAHGRTDGGEAYLIMELLEGDTVAQLLANGPLSPARCVRLAIVACEPLAHAHALGIVHRDLKPSNLFLVGGEVDGLRLLDFGLARPLVTLDQITHSEASIGTPGYMAPEQARGREVTARADVFALGCVLFECLTGSPPFAGDEGLERLLRMSLGDVPRLRSVAPELPEVLEAAVARLTAADPLARPADGRESAALLSVVLDVIRDGGLGSEVGARFGSEQRIVSVIVALPTDTAEIPAGALRDVGAEVVRLPDGTVVGTVGREGHAARQVAQAARCALAMRAALPRHALALATGRGVLDGSTPSGEALERASLLAQAVLRSSQPGGPVRIDEMTAHLLGSTFEVTEHGHGRWLWREVDAPDEPTLLGRAEPFVGRADELGTLLGVIRDAARRKTGRAVLVSGAPGVGKSRLLRELGRGARVAVSSVVVLHAEAEGRGARFGLLRQLLRSAARHDEEHDMLDRLAEEVERSMDASAAARVRMFLAELLGVATDEAPTSALQAARSDAVLMGDQLRRAWQDWLGAECAARPVLLLLDDVHAADRGSLEVIEACLRRPLPLAVIASANAGAEPIWSESLRLDLGELGPAALAAMASHALAAAATPAVVGWIIEHARGSGLVAEELIRAAARGATAALPPSLVTMVQAQLELLDLESRRLLRAASVFGGAFWVGGLAALVGGSRVDRQNIERRLEELLRAEIVTPRRPSRFAGAGENEYVFRHALRCEAAYASLTDDDRVVAHGLAARWLESVGESDALVIAEHHERAGEPRLARPWYARAARQAFEGADLPGALAHAERALECGATGEERWALWLLQAEVHGWLGVFAEVERLAGLIAEEAPRERATWLCATVRGAIAQSLSGRDEALEPAVTALRAALCGAPERTVLVEAASMVAHLQRSGRVRPAATLLEDLERAADETTHDTPMVAQLELVRSVRSLHRGDVSTSLEQRVAAITHFDRAGDVRSACRERANLGFMHVELGDLAEAERCLRAALSDAGELGLHRTTAVAEHNLGIALTRAGRLDEAAVLLERALGWFAAQTDRRLESLTHAALAEARLSAGRLEAAEAAARAALATAPAAPQRCWAQATLAAVLLRRGRPQDALELASTAKITFDELGGTGGGDALVPLVLVEALLACGDTEAARAEIEAAAARLRERAARIRDERQRAGFLGAVRENAATLELAGRLET